MKKTISLIFIIILLIPTICYPLERLWTPTDGGIVRAFRWTNEWTNIYNHPNSYLEGINTTSGVIGALAFTSLTGNITGNVAITSNVNADNIDNATITGVNYSNIVTNLNYKAITYADSPYTISNGDNLLIDTTGGQIEILCPVSPSVGWIFSYTDAKDYFSTNSLLINPNGTNFRGSSVPFCTSGTTPSPDSTNPMTSILSYKLVYGSITSGWVYYDNGKDD